MTNVVKHFKWTLQGKRRLHKKPSAREIAACIPWLEKEIELIEPEVLVCLGHPPRGTHERRTLQVLFISRLLSNEDHARRARSHAEVQSHASTRPGSANDRAAPERRWPPLAKHAIATVHPSSILRQQTDADRRREIEQFVADLKVAARLL